MDYSKKKKKKQCSGYTYTLLYSTYRNIEIENNILCKDI